MNPSPLRYPGGKHRITEYIEKLVLLNECRTFIEPFCGGASVALSLLLDRAVDRIILNDYDYGIYAFWKSAIFSTEALTDMIRKTDVTIDEWNRQKAIREGAHRSELEAGFATFFLNRTNRSGILEKAGPIGGRAQNGKYLIDCRFNKERLIRQIERIAQYRDRITVLNRDAVYLVNEDIIRLPESFTFFDPPYFEKGKSLYSCFYRKEDHARLAEAVLGSMKDMKWIITYDNAEEIRNLYRSAGSIEFSLQYTLQKKRIADEIMFLSDGLIRPQDEDGCLNIVSRRMHIEPCTIINHWPSKGISERKRH